MIRSSVSQNHHAQGSVWFDTARYGLFLHWGLYSILSDPDRNEWVLFGKNLDRDEYNQLSRQFTAEHFDPDQWAALVKRAGMRYAVLTTRHHDGFCLFKTNTTSFNSVQTGAGRDLIAAYVAAFRKAGLAVGLYYSLVNWQRPACVSGPGADPSGWKAMVSQTHEQVRELMTHYGKIDLLWYDGAIVPGIQDQAICARYWQSDRLNAMVRSLQPEILINNRSGLPEDFDTPEQHVNPPAMGRRWEACVTLNQNWGYNIHDRDFKSPQILKQALIRCARYGGNLLLGIGPRADGSIQNEFVTRLESVGQWLECNGEAIYDSQRTDYSEAAHVAGTATQRGKQVYVHMADYPGSMVRLDGLAAATHVQFIGQSQALCLTPSCHGALEVSGITRNLPWQEGPMVLKITLPTENPGTAKWLGGADELRMTEGQKLPLGFDADRYAPPVMPVISGHLLLEELDLQQQSIMTTASEQWCPGWCGWQVYRSQSGTSLTLTLDVPVMNTYQLDLGLIAPQDCEIGIEVEGCELAERFVVKHPGCPQTWQLPPLILNQGKCQITLTCDKILGLYAIRRNACWREMHAELWWTVGPFHTDFGPQNSVNDVLCAMSRVYPPQEHFDPEATYTGARDLSVRWTHSDRRQGEHSDTGVNFPYRCGEQVSGVCFARTTIISPQERDAEILIGCDWWLNAWLNGEFIQSTRSAQEIAKDGSQFNGWKPKPARIRLKRGPNQLFIKSHPGACANWFTCRISDPGDLQVSADHPLSVK